MLTINQNQFGHFGDHSRNTFEEEMVTHVKTYYPNHYHSMQEEAIRKTIRFCLTRSEKYGMTTWRNACLYLNSMLILGSRFDEDPQYPWALEMLSDEWEYDPNIRMDRVSDKTLQTFGEISGAHHRHLNKALMNFQNNIYPIQQDVLKSSKDMVLPLLKTIFPRKFEVVGEANLRNLILYCEQIAVGFSMKSESSAAALLLFMFLSGAGVHSDPQFPWVSAILTNHKMPEDEKVTMLFEGAETHLKNFLDHHKLNQDANV